MNIFVCFISLILGCIGAWVIKGIALKWGLIDRPNLRSSHESPTPKGGGIGILAAFILAAFYLRMSFFLWVPAAMLSLFSFLGDRFELSPRFRLPLQFVAAVSLLFGTSDLWPLTSLFYFIFFTIFLVATANWYNFMDGINGIAGITGVVGFGLLAVFNVFYNGDNHFSILTICISFSCLGFLPFNVPKARVFMGDVGSILLGFLFATTVIFLSKSVLDFICLAGFLFPFYADEFVTMYIRLKDGENLLKPHRRHFYQILANEKGIAHWKVSVGYGLLQVVVGVGCLFVRQFGSYAVVSLLAMVFSGFIWANYAVRGKAEDKKSK
jgi:Fuc2NAc and GlcNAc transferase